MAAGLPIGLAIHACSSEETAPVGPTSTGTAATGTGTEPADGGCTPAECTPCDCGPTDDGCGGILQCGDCPEPPSCTDSYGTVEGFELCEETDDQCAFRALKNGSTSCREICEDQGGTCLATWGNGVGCETVYDDVDLGCEASDHDDDVCVCSRVTDAYAELPCVDASVPIDGSTGDAGPPTGTTLLYRVDFEDQTIDADPGSSHDELMSGGAVTVVANPHEDARNGSEWVGRHAVPTGYTRAELSSQRLTTVDRTYLYKASYFIPSTFFDGDISWNLISQWKTWPCGDHDGYDAEICGSCGIFNDLSARTDTFHFKYRAEPDCFTAGPPMYTGQWVDFVSEIHWANDATGSVRLWQNGVLVYDQPSMKTLFDNFDPSSCNLYWAVGLYSSNTGGLHLFTDDIEIWEL